MTDFRVRVGLRDPDSSKYVGEADRWDRAEQACRDAAATLGVPFTEEAGEAAFYGPKSTLLCGMSSVENGNSEPYRWITNLARTI